MEPPFFYRWICTIGLLVLSLALPKAHSRSITLEESLQHALAHNETLQISREDLAKSRQQIRQAAADAFPQFDLTLRYTRNWLLPSFLFGQEQFTVGHTTILPAHSASGNPSLVVGKHLRLFALHDYLKPFRQKP